MVAWIFLFCRALCKDDKDMSLAFQISFQAKKLSQPDISADVGSVRLHPRLIPACSGNVFCLSQNGGWTDFFYICMIFSVTKAYRKTLSINTTLDPQQLSLTIPFKKMYRLYYMTASYTPSQNVTIGLALIRMAKKRGIAVRLGVIYDFQASNRKQGGLPVRAPLPPPHSGWSLWSHI